MRYLALVTALVGAIALATSCGSTTQKTAIISFEAKADGPFFTGPNSLMSEYTVDLSSIIEGTELKAEDIKSIKLSAAQIDLSKNDSMNLNNFNSASLQFVSPNEPMTSVAVLNPIEAEGNETTLNASNEADLAPFFKEESLTLVLDLEFKEDAFIEQIMADINLELTFEIKN